MATNDKLLYVKYFPFSSVFAGGPIPYPKREFLSDEEQDDKSENKVSLVNYSGLPVYDMKLFLSYFLKYKCMDNRFFIQKAYQRL